MTDPAPMKNKATMSENCISDIVHINLTSYLAEVISMQFPSAIDGLKIVHKRFLWAGHKGEFNNETKSAIVIGAVLKTHNYGDTSAYLALVRLAQIWNVNPPLIKLIGNYGSYSGDEPAASRYTAMELTPFARDVFFGGIDLNVLPMKLTTDGEREPQHFIPALPTALLYDSLTIGFGYQSHTVALNLGNVCDLVTAYGLHQSKQPHKPFDFAKHAEKFLPDFPNPGVLTNATELTAAYRKGQYDTKITLDGHVVLSHDRILLQSLPEAANFAKAAMTIESAIREKQGNFDAWILAIYHPAKIIDFGSLTVELKRGVNVFDVWDELKKLLKFSGTMTPIQNYTTSSDRLISLSVLSLLYVWFEHRRNVLMSSKRRRLEFLQRNLRIIEAQLIVYDHVDDVVSLIRNQNTREDAVVALRQRFDLSEFQATSLTRLEIGDLAKTARSDLESKRDKTTTEITALTESFLKIGEEIAQDAQRIKRTYPTPRRTVIPKYIGCVTIAGGVIQIESTDELPEIATRFPRGELRVTMYDGPHILHILPDGKPARRTASKYTRGEIYGLDFSGDSGYTVTLNDGTACCVSGVVPGHRSDGYYYTTKLAKALTRRGSVRTIDVTKDISMRKSLGRGANTDIIYLYPNTTSTHYLIILNDREPNIIHLQRVEGDANGVTMSPVGLLCISHSISGKNWYLSIPDNYLNRVSARIFHIVDAEAILGTERQMKLDLGSNRVRRNPLINMIA